MVHRERGPTASMMPASVWDDHLRWGLNSGRASEEARAELEKRAWAFYTKHCGRDAPDFDRISGLSDELWERSQFDEVVELDEITMQLAEQSYGPTHLHTLQFKGNLACAISFQGRYTEAEILELEVVDSLELKLDENDELLLKYKANLGDTYMSQGKLERAEALLREVVERASSNIEGRDLFLTAKENLAQTLRFQGWHNEATAMLGKVITARECDLGIAHQKTLKAKITLASTTLDANDLDKSRELNEEIFHQLHSNYPQTLPWTLEAWQNQGRQLASLGQHIEAEGIFRDLVNKKTRLFSATHPETLSTLSYLATSLYYQYKFRASRKDRERNPVHLDGSYGRSQPGQFYTTWQT